MRLVTLELCHALTRVSHLHAVCLQQFSCCCMDSRLTAQLSYFVEKGEAALFAGNSTSGPRLPGSAAFSASSDP